MYLYVIFGILGLCSVIEVLNIKVKDCPNFYKKAYWIFIALFLILSAFRWEVGTDWDSYYIYFNIIKSGGFDEAYLEPGFTLLTYGSGKIGGYFIQITFVALLSIVPIAINLNKLSPYPLFTLFIWYSVNFAHIFAVRQSIAISFFVLSWPYIQKKEFWKYLMIMLLAFLFHYSSIIAFPAYWLWNLKLNNRRFVVIIVVVAVLSLFASNLITNMMYAVGGDFFRSKLDAYMEMGEEAFGAQISPRQVLIRGIINRSLYFFGPLFFLTKIREKNKELNGLFNLYFYGFLLFVILAPFSVGLSRAASYTDITQTLLLPFVFTRKMKFSSRVIIAVVLILYFGIRFNGIVNNYYDLYVPYKSIFQ